MKCAFAVRLVVLTLTFVCGLASCKTVPREEPPRPLPRVDEIRSRLEPVAPETEASESAVAAIEPTQANIRRYELPLERNLAKAWSLVTQERLPPALVELWLANGLYIGEIEIAQLREFETAMGMPSGVRHSTLVSSNTFTAVETAPRLLQTETLEWHTPPNASIKLPAARGRFQLLLRAAPAEVEGQISLEVVPHLHQLKASLTPQSPMEKALAGRIFSEVALSHLTDPSRLLVIAPVPIFPEPAAPAAPEEPPAAEEGTAQTVANEEAVVPAEPTSDDSLVKSEPDTEQDASRTEKHDGPPPLPNHMGRHLLTLSRFNKPLQMVVMVQVQPLQRGPQLDN